MKFQISKNFYTVWLLCLPGILSPVCKADAAAAEPGSSVVIVYNSRLPESRRVAEYYARRRQVPSNQIFGFELPTSESMTREQFVKKLQLPLWEKLDSSKLWQLGPVTNVSVKAPLAPPRRVVSSSFRYLLLCYGVPTKVLRDTNLVETIASRLPELLRRNEASVDADLACLPLIKQNMIWTGPTVNPFFGVTNAAALNPARNILLVTRLDGPSPTIAMGLVDKALEAETNGLWGRAYVDARGITGGGYKTGDDYMRNAAAMLRAFGFETELDEKPETFSAGHPLSQIAFYLGWYDEHVSGPFARSNVEFMPGAFAYHLHSFSASVLRTTNQHWAGPLLAKGATITLGCVDEPYLQGTPDVAMFVSRFIYHGFSFGEAAYAAQSSVSWQTIAVGDPLYRPFARSPAALQADLQRRRSPLLEWACLGGINRQQAAGADLEDLILALERLRLARNSPILLEKLADLYWKNKRLSESIDCYQQALKRSASAPQKIRLWLTLGEKQAIYGPDTVPYETYQRFLREFPDYPEPLGIYQKLLTLARNLDKKEDLARWEQMVQRLSPPPKPALGTLK